MSRSAGAGGPAWTRVAACVAAAGATALVLVACETTAEKSAKLEHAAKQASARAARNDKGLTIARESAFVKPLASTVVVGAEGAAAVVTVRNLSSRTLASVPLAITVKSASGQTLFQNDAPGLEAALTSIPLLPAHGEFTWVDDQLSKSGPPASVSVRIGEAPALRTAAPQIEVEGLHPEEAGASAAGTVRNRSHVAQHKLVVFVVARRAGAVSAAGRAVLAEVAPGAAAPFQVFFVGSAAGASLQASAPATTLG
jgi:hypothetical protein